MNNRLINLVNVCLFSEVKSSIFPIMNKTWYWHKNALYMKAVISSEVVSSLHNNTVWAIGGLPVKNLNQFNICSSIPFWTWPILSSSNRYPNKPTNFSLYLSWMIFCLYIVSGFKLFFFKKSDKKFLMFSNKHIYLSSLFNS